MLAVGGALFTAGAAQLTIHVPWTPVPITGQTFAVLLVAAALGMRLGVASQALYVVLGAIGLPFDAGRRGRLDGRDRVDCRRPRRVRAARPLIVGRLAERRQDRSLLTSLPAFAFGSAGRGRLTADGSTTRSACRPSRRIELRRRRRT